ncbi:hypothetical protein DNU06_06055 [Putridiphycobacter roseus]|uniref:DUF4870 domain-containing protein n=1 Tax=Putridiphycobacter roseus TaxID=2219161 RepID=A0A2W1NFC6_9FLAO|nr:hypothetical protein [Putridiphycobacter roseus]PZE18175.1 hypothetical protein DNU06_06055 [Putridiphycobacter roseus]
MNDNFIIDQDDVGGAPSETGKTRAIIAHITLIGTIIALVQNNNDKNSFASFYIRQMFGLVVVGLAIYLLSYIIALVVPSLFIIVTILRLGLIALWILSLIGAVNGERKLTPGVGQMFQEWFKTL